MRNNLRPADIPARTGGDEFLIILPETDLESAKEVIGRLQDVLVATMKEKKCPVTFSIGAATYTEPPDSLDEMIKSADELMYSVKSKGKNNLRLEAL
jgi:diguanylate cyclase (GGDEF)-like protein